MEKSAELLLGATFEGYLTPPDGKKCRVTYSFSKIRLQAIPPVVEQQRREIGWRCGATVWALKASCSLPLLDILNEEVVVSVDPPTSSGTRQMLLQSLKRPELGLTLLVLAADGRELTGGDESWSPGDAPVIRAAVQAESLQPAGGYPSEAVKASSAKAAAAAEAESAKSRAELEAKATQAKAAATVLAPARPAAAPAAVLRPSFGKLGMKDTVVDESTYRDILPGLYECCVGEEHRGAWRSHPENAGPHAPIDGGIGRSVMGAAAPTRHAPSKISKEDAALLQEPKASSGPTGAGTTDEEILAAKADMADRLVSAAANGELGDVKMLAARIGTNSASSDVGMTGQRIARQPGLTPLMAAVQKGRGETVAFLIEQGADLNAADQEGWTAVMHAVFKQRTELLKTLLKARASPVVAGADEGTTPLHLAAMGARSELAAALLAVLPPAAREAKDDLGRTALHAAAKNGRNATLVAILKAKGRVETRDNDGRTPLMIAAASDHPESLHLLIEGKADVNSQDSNGLTAESLARLHDHQRVLESLLSIPDPRAHLR